MSQRYQEIRGGPGMTGFLSSVRHAIADGRVIVPLVAGICLLALVVILKNVLQVPAERLTGDMILYIILYMGFIVTYPLHGPGAESAQRAAVWSGIIVLITLGIIGVNAL